MPQNELLKLTEFVQKISEQKSRQEISDRARSTAAQKAAGSERFIHRELARPTTAKYAF